MKTQKKKKQNKIKSKCSCADVSNIGAATFLLEKIYLAPLLWESGAELPPKARISPATKISGAKMFIF